MREESTKQVDTSKETTHPAAAAAAAADDDNDSLRQGDKDENDDGSSVGPSSDNDASSIHSEQQDQQDGILPSWISRLAILGDSPLALMFSALLLLASIGLSWYLANEAALSPEEKAYRQLGPPPRAVGPPQIYQIDDSTLAAADQITHDIQVAYQHDGVVAIRGLVSPTLLHDLQQASDQLVREQHLQNAQKRFKVRGKQFFTVHHGAVFRTPETLRNQTQHDHDMNMNNHQDPMENPFLRLLIQSSLPQVAATLLHPIITGSSSADKKNNLRLLRDIFLAKDDDPYVCGWHVDDHGFWPALADAPGINAWIALDDYNDTMSGSSLDDQVDQEGGFALAVASHTAPWRHQAYQVTGAAHTVPTEGFSSALDMVQRRQGSGTCNIKHAAPHLQRRLEETKRVYRDLQAGDIIFHDRWLFHRTIPQTGASKKIRRRYSVRLGPGSSIIPPGYGTEPSVLYRDQHGGQTANQVSKTWPWYPRVWPQADDTELSAWREFCDSIYPEAIEKQNARKKELKPHLQRLAQQQQIHPQANNILFDFSEGYS